MFSSTLLRYVGVQVGLVALDYAIYAAIVTLQLMPPVAAFLATRSITGTLGYFAHTRITFDSKQDHRVGGLRYAALLLFNAAVASFILSRLVGYAGAYFAKIAADGAMLIFNFFVSKRFVFKR